MVDEVGLAVPVRIRVSPTLVRQSAQEYISNTLDTSCLFPGDAFNDEERLTLQSAICNLRCLSCTIKLEHLIVQTFCIESALHSPSGEVREID
jgi:hypothetical protein